MRYTIAFGPRLFKLKILNLSGPKALVLLQVLMPLVNWSGEHSGKVMYFGSFCFRGELRFRNCDDICMYVVNKQFEFREVVLVRFMLTCSIMRFISLLLCVCVVYIVVVLGLSVGLPWYPMW